MSIAGTISPEDRHLLLVTDDLEEAARYIRAKAIERFGLRRPIGHPRCSANRPAAAVAERRRWEPLPAVARRFAVMTLASIRGRARSAGGTAAEPAGAGGHQAAGRKRGGPFRYPDAAAHRRPAPRAARSRAVVCAP